MGTRALINIKENGEESPTIVTIYRQYDGYPSGLGLEIIRELIGSKVVNGIGSAQDVPLFFNGMGCLSAYLVKMLKKDIGGVYLYAPGSIDVGEDWTYTIFQEGDAAMLEIICYYDSVKRARINLSTCKTDDLKGFLKFLEKDSEE